MMKSRSTKLLHILMLTLLICIIPAAVAIGYAGGDTGTYKIVDYRVLLTPHPDGKVAIDYYQKWMVTGGDIPWITVGVPNQNYTIESYGDAAKSASESNSGDSSDVRLDLNKDYKAGEAFEIKFSILQSNLFYADAQNYHLEFTPGWYDRAAIDALEIRIKCFFKLDSVTANPPASSQSDDYLVWDKSNLSPGQHVAVAISFPKEALPAALPQENLRNDEGSESGSGLGFFGFIIVVIIIVGGLWLMGFFGGGGAYSGGGIFFGGLPGGGSSGGGSSGGSRSSGGGGGFGGRGISCACACVACACACACAGGGGGGGGGAGCTRKLHHICPLCREGGAAQGSPSSAVGGEGWASSDAASARSDEGSTSPSSPYLGKTNNVPGSKP